MRDHGQLVNALDVEIPRVRPSALYTLGLLVVAVAMVLLPLVYLGIVALVGYGGWLWASTMHTVFDHVSGRGVIFAAIVYLGPLVAGAILLLFMVKPLFAPAAEPDGNRLLSPEEQPGLFAFVEQLCRVVGAPMPREIRVDSAVNASAGFRRGWLGLLTGELVLTLGLPLVAGMSLQQLAGVLAHEFGHFSQGVAMRLTFVIRSVNRWFFRVAFERDAWDGWLQRSSGEIDFRIGIVLYAARGCVWLTRQLLKGLAYVGHGISCFMMRQMEYDADRYEIHLGGSQSFEATAERLAILNLWMAGAYQDVQGALRDGRLPDSLPALMLSQDAEFPQDVMEQALQSVREDETHWAATHPSDADRIAAARRVGAPGLFTLQRPAQELLVGFEVLAKELTHATYLEQLGAEQLEQVELVSTDEALAQRTIERTAHEAAERFFFGQLNPLRPLTLDHDGPVSGSRESAAARLAELRQQMRDSAERYAKVYQDFDEADDDQLNAAMAGFMLQARFELSKGTFGLQTPDHSGVALLELETQQRLGQLGSDLGPFEAAAAQRLFLALGLIDQGSVEIDDLAESADELAELRSLVRSTAELSPALLELRNLYHGAMLLVRQFEEGDPTEESLAALRGRCELLHERLSALRVSLGDQPYPFRLPGAAESTLRDIAVPVLPSPEEMGELLDACSGALSKLLVLHGRALGRLAVVAEQVEAALGLERIERPDGSEEAEDAARAA